MPDNSENHPSDDQTFLTISNISNENGIHVQDFGKFSFGNFSSKFSSVH